jgi:hypothetical protein
MIYDMEARDKGKRQAKGCDILMEKRRIHAEELKMKLACPARRLSGS